MDYPKRYKRKDEIEDGVMSYVMEEFERYDVATADVGLLVMVMPAYTPQEWATAAQQGQIRGLKINSEDLHITMSDFIMRFPIFRVCDGELQATYANGSSRHNRSFLLADPNFCQQVAELIREIVRQYAPSKLAGVFPDPPQSNQHNVVVQ